jgi:hypothetical protein
MPVAYDMMSNEESCHFFLMSNYIIELFDWCYKLYYISKRKEQYKEAQCNLCLHLRFSERIFVWVVIPDILRRFRTLLRHILTKVILHQTQSCILQLALGYTSIDTYHPSTNSTGTQILVVLGPPRNLNPLYHRKLSNQLLHPILPSRSPHPMKQSRLRNNQTPRTNSKHFLTHHTKLSDNIHKSLIHQHLCISFASRNHHNVPCRTNCHAFLHRMHFASG